MRIRYEEDSFFKKKKPCTLFSYYLMYNIFVTKDIRSLKACTFSLLNLEGSAADFSGIFLSFNVLESDVTVLFLILPAIISSCLYSCDVPILERLGGIWHVYAANEILFTFIRAIYSDLTNLWLLRRTFLQRLQKIVGL